MSEVFGEWVRECLESGRGSVWSKCDMVVHEMREDWGVVGGMA